MVGRRREIGTPTTSSLRTDDSKNLTSATKDVPGPYWGLSPQATRMLNVYHFVYRQYGYRFKPTHHDIQWFEWLAATNRLEVYLKWRTANILAHAVSSFETVPCPLNFEKIPGYFSSYLEERVGLLGSDRSFYRMKLHRLRYRQDERFVTFCFALYQSKAASLPAPDWKIDLAVRETEARLLRDKEVADVLETSGGVTLSEERMLKEIDRTVDEIYKTPLQRECPRRLPGRAACIENSRREGGALGHVVNILRYDFLPYDFLVGFFEGPSGVAPVYSSIGTDDWDWAMETLRSQALGRDHVECHPVGFAEPFKVRTVTLGEASVYGLARDYQPYLWRPLRDHPTFQLVGRKLDAQVLYHFTSKLDPKRDTMLISGDYKEATDHIPSYLSERVMARICYRLRIPLEHQKALLVALTRHHLDTFDEETGYQQSGQLMGSPVSFPVLCILNAAASRLSLEVARGGEYREPRLLRDLPMLVNGDDLLLGGGWTEYYAWKEVVAWMGLLPSVGKTLVSEDYCSLNSTLIRRYQNGPGKAYLSIVPHLQLQLALGSMKSGSYDLDGLLKSEPNPLSESRMWTEFLSSCPDRVSGWRFLWGANRKYLMALAKYFPHAALCLAPEAGGLGFPMPPRASPFFEIRTPRKGCLLLARMLLEGGTPNHARLAGAWKNSLTQFVEKPSEHLLYKQQALLERQTGCPFLFIQEEDWESLVPPQILNSRIATSRSEGEALCQTVSERGALWRTLLRSLKDYSRSGRGPWTSAEVDAFQKSGRWCFCYGRYSSCH